MALTKYKFGDLIELTNQKNDDVCYGEDDAIGVNIDKIIIPMRGNISEKDFSQFHLVPPRHFAYNPRGSRKLGIGFNDTEKTYIITFNDNVFRIKEAAKNIIIDAYLFMYLCRKEWDRYAEYISWGSSTEVFDWNNFCEEEIKLPPLPIQQKYVDVYNAMLANQKSYERGLDDLKLVCDAYIEDLRRKIPCESIGNYITQKNDRNTDKSIDYVMGLSTQKKFREPQSRVNRDELGSYKIVKPYDFAFVPTTDSWKVLAFSFNTFEKDIVVSPIYEVFSVDKDKIIPEYLAMWLSRTEFDRYTRFHSWGSARENFSYEDMCNVSIPIPKKNIQKSIVDIYNAYKERKSINERLKTQIKDICPILIKGSIEEAMEAENVHTAV